MTELRPTELTCDEVRDLAAPFVLDALDDAEASAMRRHLASCDDPHAEIAELASALPVLAASVPVVEPPASLKARVLGAAAADLAARGPAAGDPATPAAPVSLATRRAGRGQLGTWALRIAAILAIALVGGWNVLLQGELDDARRYEQSVAAVLDVAGRDGSLTALLSADGGGGPTGLAAVSTSGEVTLAMRDLSPTTAGDVYEAWVIGGDGVPVPLGSFTVGGAGTASFRATGIPAQDGIVLALTREPGPGATTPTLPIVSMGTATAAG
ncbi:MAG: anti-sigma factor [Chloroflexota bacterium]